MVRNENINTVEFWRGFKRDYDALVASDSISLNTVYFIIGENGDTGEIYVHGKLVSNVSNRIIECGTASIEDKNRFVIRSDKRLNWEEVNPILLENELVIESDSGMFKLGDGVSAYTELPYVSGGSGGGGSSRPVIESEFDKKYCRTDEIITIDYFVSTPNSGLCNAYYLIDNAMTSAKPVSIEQGNNTWVVGKLPKGEHVLKLYIVDSGKLYSNNLIYKITSGSLELVSEFKDSEQYEPNTDVVIDFFVDSVFKNKQIKLTKSISYGVTSEKFEEVLEGSKAIYWNIKDFINGRLGVYKISINAETIETDGETVPIKSNTLAYTIIVGAGDSLFISTDIDNNKRYTTDDVINLPFRISMKNQKYFKTEVSINGVKSTLNTKYGVNYWQIGKKIVGEYNLTIQTFTEDYKIESNIIELTIGVEAASDVEVTPEMMNLVAWYDGTEMSNDYPPSSEGGSGPFRDIWTDKSGRNVKLQLVDVGYTQVNGWVNNTLKLNGESYAVIDYKPLIDNVTNGLCIDITYRTQNVGVDEARVISCESNEGYGFLIKPGEARLQSSKRDLCSYYTENEWTRMSMMIDRNRRLMYIYINGILSDVANIDETSDNLDTFLCDGKIYLNCRMLQSGVATDFGSCEIKNIRIYSRPISSDAVVRNYIYDIEDTDIKKHKYKMNYDPSYALPTLTVIGDLSEMTKDKRVVVTAIYDGKGGEFGENFELDSCQLNWQGTSSLVYPVKNLKIRLGMMVNGVREKVNFSPLKHWNPYPTFTLKTDYMESGHTNNTGTAKIANTLYTEKLPPQVLDPNVRTCIDGFPVTMYNTYNTMPDGTGETITEYMGVFMFNIDKGADSCFGFSRKKWPENLSYEISANSDVGAGAFRVDDDESVSRELELRFPDEADTWKDHSKIRRMITFVKNSTDAEFKANFDKYFNKDFTIKYFLQVLTFGMVDSLGKNMMVNTWDGLRWYPTFYDMDTMLGLDNTGQIRIPVSAEIKSGLWNTSNSLLWTKVQKNFDSEIKAAYAELRAKNNTYDYDRLIAVYEGEIVSKIAEKYYNDDAYTKYIDNVDGRNKYLYACHGSRLEFTKKWIRERLIFMDTLMGYTGSDVKYECSFRANKQGKVTLRLKTYTPMYVTVNFAATVGAQLTYLCGPDKYTDYEWNLLTATDQEINITCAPHLKEIEGLKDFRPSTILFEKATKLTNIDCSESAFLKQASLNGMTNLRSVNLSNCSNLGTLVGGDTVINVSECPNLKTLLLGNTQITGVTLLNGGGYKTIDVSNTKLREFKVSNMAYLDTVGLTGCYNLETVDISNCDKIISLNMSGNKASKVSVDRCAGIESINLNNNAGLSYLNLKNCPNLSKVSVSTILNKEFNTLDLSGCKNLQDLNISQSKYINTIILNEYTDETSPLIKLIANNSGIQNIKYGVDDTESIGVNFEKMPNLSQVDFGYCDKIEKITNLVLNENGKANFYRCIKLNTITGKLTLVGDITGLFYNCTDLIDYPDMDLTGVTVARNAFAYNPNMGDRYCYNIMKSFSDKLTDISDIFFNNRNITELFGDMFINTPNIRNMSNSFRSTNVSIIPEGLLDPIGENLINLSGAFAYTKITSIPETLFDTNIYIDNVSSCFENCNLLTEIPANIFKDKINIYTTVKCFANCNSASLVLGKPFMQNIENVRSVSSMFENCNSITGSGENGSLEANLLEANTILTNANAFIKGCTSITGAIPEELFINNKKLQDIGSFFENCQGISGEIPANLLNNLLNDKGTCELGTCDRLFSGCYNLTGEIPATFFDSPVSLTKISHAFLNCNKLTGEIPNTLLHKLKSLMDAENLFRGCTLLSGSIPADLFSMNKNLRNVGGVFSRCEGLGGSIPSTLFTNNTNLSQANDFISYCPNIIGGIPKELFKTTTLLTSLNSAFKGCTGLVNDDTSDYFVSEDLLDNCQYLSDIGGLFAETNFSGSVPPLMFTNLRNLENISELFFNTIGINGNLGSRMFQNCNRLKNVSKAFGFTGIVSIVQNNDAVFRISNNPLIEFFEESFSNCVELDYAPPLWSSYLESTGSGCFSQCIKASNYTEIPSTWK